MCFAGEHNSVLLLIHGLVKVKVTNMVDIVSMLFCQHTNSINEHMLSQLYKRNINVKQSMGHQLRILSTFFQRCFVSFKTTSINLRHWLNFCIQANILIETKLMRV